MSIASTESCLPIRPGFDDFMSSVQIHLAKSWFAGKNENWRLADFEIHEITEKIEAIRTFQSDRKETQLIIMRTTRPGQHRFSYSNQEFRKVPH